MMTTVVCLWSGHPGYILIHRRFIHTRSC